MVSTASHNSLYPAQVDHFSFSFFVFQQNWLFDEKKKTFPSEFGLWLHLVDADACKHIKRQHTKHMKPIFIR